MIEHHQGLAEDENGHGHDQCEEKVEGQRLVPREGGVGWMLVMDWWGWDGGFHEPVDEAD